MNLLILGAGGHGHVVSETARAMGVFERIDYLDDNSDEAVGLLEDYQRLRETYQAAFPALGDNELRKVWLGRLSLAGYDIPSLVHPRAYVSPSAAVGTGVIIEPMACVNSRTAIGAGCIISISTVIDHDCEIGEYAHIDCGVVLPPRSSIKAFCKISNKS